jgi:hypothetical protein
VVAVAAYDTQMNITHELFDNDPKQPRRAAAIAT